MNSVLIVAHWTLYTCSGSIYIPSTHYSYCKFLLDRGDRLHILCILKNSGEIPKGYVEVSQKVSVYALPAYRSYWTVYGITFSLSRVLRRLFDERRFDLVYVRAPDPLCWLPALLVPRGVRLNYHVVGDAIDATINGDGKLIKKIIKSVFYFPEYLLFAVLARLRATQVFCNGPHLKRRLGYVGLSRVRTVISSTISLNDLKPLPLESSSTNGPLRVLYVGYLRPAKGVMELLAAVRSLTLGGIDLTLTIVGDGEYAAELRRYVEENDLSSRVAFLGHIDDRSRLKEIYRDHDLFSFFSHSEGSPRVVLEAVANGLAVVATPVGSLPYCFSNDELFFSEDFSDQAIERALRRAIQTPSEARDRMRTSALEKVRSNYLKEGFLSEIFS